ncbi:hypothetical protein [Sphingobacterium sp.]|uniref:hypothetical protein n=1 Tax=Sphingobacterium sp. TaxID=341027 RepID=UPI002898F148|nr:hypothetical protein [Sphingobacterium sp.]
MTTFDKLFGGDHADKMAILDEKLKIIQEKHSKWFNERLDYFEDGRQMSILDVRSIAYNNSNGQVIFRFNIEDLPAEIEAELREAFQESF